VTTLPSEAAAPEREPPERLPRFDRVERALHWATAALVFVLLVTAAVLYFGELATFVGRRELVRRVHVVCGLLLPVPLLLALAGRWGRGLLADIRAFNRWDADDRRWLRSWGRDPGVRLSKFNPGQKLNAAFVGGAFGVMLVTGSIMHWFDPFPLSWRTGATFVHDWTSIALALVIAGHIRMALGDRDALRGMVRGWVPSEWGRRHRPRWYEDQTGRRASGAAGETHRVGALHRGPGVAGGPGA
jgi:formate dehydrogenase subunit gamma